MKTGGFNVWRWLFGRDKKKTNDEGKTHHDELNKDNDKTPQGKKTEGGTSLHEYAKRTALKHTKKILEEKKKESENANKKGNP